MTWYREQAAQMRDTLAYPATMSHELGSYYTGPLLHEARESIYYNQRAGRVVFGLWEKIEEIDGPQWSHDGQYATFIMAVRGYEFMILPPPPPERPAGAPPPPRHPVQQWQITMVYDVKDGRWKIWQAHILPQF
jgi:hypothetical protein